MESQPIQAAATAPGEPSGEQAGASLEELCPRLLELCRRVGVQLRMVTDRTSADEAAVVLDQHLAEMLKILQMIERIPPQNAAQAQILTTHMGDLTHMAQGYNPVVQRITEVNCYGSDALLQVLSKYKVMSPGNTSSQGTQHIGERLIRLEELGDCAEDALYQLRRIKTREDAIAALRKLSDIVARLSETREQVLALPANISTDQFQAQEAQTRRLRELRNNLQAESERLLESDYCGVPALEQLCRDAIDHVSGSF